MDLQQLQNELDRELEHILRYWIQYAPDTVHGGFYGRIDQLNKCYADAPKGAVLNARILWTFSAAWLQNPQSGYLAMAQRAFDYINLHFVDHRYGGVYWTVDGCGHPLDTKKQVYALAFVIYACSAWYRCSGSEEAKDLAIDLYRHIQQYSYDARHGGYLEAFTRQWSPISDLRLSAKDANEKKTMNTHLHVLEAYTALYRIWPDKLLAGHIGRLLYNFHDHIINRQTGHLHLFFDEIWNLRSDTVSYGHDIEAGWLLCEAAEALQDSALINKMRTNALLLANGVTEGLDSDGGLWYEYEPAEQKLVREKHWWPQAEALVGFFHAWQLSGEENYLHYVFAGWEFIQRHIRDPVRGEWVWGIDGNYVVMQGQDKAGIWKCPYHNGRACLEITGRIKEMDC